MNTSTGATAVSPETPLDHKPPVAADLATGRMYDMQSLIYSKAKREARHYGLESPKQIESLMESIRYREFRKAIEPYERFRNKPIFSWLSLQVSPGEPYPDWLKKHIALWDGLIADEAVKFGYERPIPNVSAGL